MKKHLIPISLIFAAIFIVFACLPQHLQKYRRNNNATTANQPADSNIDGPGGDINDPVPSTKQTPPPAKGASVYAIDRNTFRFLLRENDVWDSALNVLLRNYNINIVDRNSGVITTEWDSFYLNQAVYRNKISLRIQRIGRGTVDVLIHNSVEKLQDGSQAGTVGAVWLPSEDSNNEIARLVQNMALLLNQPPPVLPAESQIAKGTGPSPEDKVPR